MNNGLTSQSTDTRFRLDWTPVLNASLIRKINRRRSPRTEMKIAERKNRGGSARISCPERTKRIVPPRVLIRILIAEDHAVVRDGLVAIIKQEQDMEVVAETGDGRQAVELWKIHRPDVALIDLSMPGLDGVNVTTAIRAADPKARIVILTTFDGDEDIYQGMRAGAKSYLTKDVKREQLFRCIREVNAGGRYLPPDVAAKLAERLPAEELTARELEVLRLLASGKPNKLIGVDLAITEVTVKSHVQSIFRKLNVLSRTEAIAVAGKKGLLRF
jgi:DNA-binding NarL/FixJ family response regulator